MSSQLAMNKEAQEFVAKLNEADLVVGIPSYNNAGTIAHVAQTAADGLSRYFPGAKALLMNTDGGSSDGTRKVFMKISAPKDVHVLATEYEGMPGKGTALKAVFEACSSLGSRGCIVVDSDLRSITPEWIRLLGEPLVKGGTDYVTPLYLRHKYDGTITNSLAYPLTRALYGKRIRQPIGGDFGVSRKLAESYLAKDVWGTETARFGIDIFMTTTAVAEGFEIKQANLGAKIHDPKDPSDLVPMLRQVVGTMFGMMKRHEGAWMAVQGSAPVPSVGPDYKQEPEPVKVNLSALLKSFKEGVRAKQPFWKEFLSARVMSEVEKLTGLDEQRFQFPAELWVKVVYEFAITYNSGALDPREIMESLPPLYFGRTAGFVGETEHMTTAQANEVIEAVAEAFEKNKPYLVDLWKNR